VRFGAVLCHPALCCLVHAVLCYAMPPCPVLSCACCAALCCATPPCAVLSCARCAALRCAVFCMLSCSVLCCGAMCHAIQCQTASDLTPSRCKSQHSNTLLSISHVTSSEKSILQGFWETLRTMHCNAGVPCYAKSCYAMLCYAVTAVCHCFCCMSLTTLLHDSACVTIAVFVSPGLRQQHVTAAACDSRSM
jgi:hypothetical protein